MTLQHGDLMHHSPRNVVVSLPTEQIGAELIIAISDPTWTSVVITMTIFVFEATLLAHVLVRTPGVIPWPFTLAFLGVAILASVHERLLFRAVTVVMVMSTSDTGFIVAFDIFIVTCPCSVLGGEALLVVVWLNARVVCVTAITIIPEVVSWHHNGASRGQGNLYKQFAEITEHVQFEQLILFFQCKVCQT